MVNGLHRFRVLLLFNILKSPLVIYLVFLTSVVTLRYSTFVGRKQFPFRSDVPQHLDCRVYKSTPSSQLLFDTLQNRSHLL